MNGMFASLYKSSPALRFLLRFPRHVYETVFRSRLSDEEWCKLTFRINHGCALNLASPRTLNEKIQWLKLYYHRKDYTQWADKAGARELVRRCLADEYLIPVLALADDPSSIDFQSLPLPYIIKPTHSSGRVRIVRSREDVRPQHFVAECRQWLKSDFYAQSREFPYRDIPRQIIVERLLIDDDGGMPSDYKFHCINGEVAFIQVDLDRHTNHRRNFYDVHWNRLPFVWCSFAGERPLWPGGRDIGKPEALDAMLEASRTLARQFPYARIDWYYCNRRIYFGEVTFYHGGGFERMVPVEYDLHYGQALTLPEKI